MLIIKKKFIMGAAFLITLLLYPFSASSQTTEEIGSISGLNNPLGIQVDGNYAYVVNNADDSLAIINISNPQKPEIVSTLSGLNDPRDIYLSGNYAYVTNYHGGYLSVVDISDPESPKEVSKVEGLIGPWNGIYVLEKYVYLTNVDEGSMVVINVSDPLSPIISGKVIGLKKPQGIYVKENYAYVANAEGISSVIDISDPQKPVIVSTIPGLSGGMGIFGSNQYLYLTNLSRNTVSVFDISDPLNVKSLSVIGHFHTPIKIYVYGKYAYVTNYIGNSISIIDITNPASPVIALTIPGFDRPNGIFVNGKYIFVNNFNGNSMSILNAYQIFYQITATSGEGGSISPAGITEIEEGKNQMYQVIPDPGFSIVEVTVNGESKGMITNYEFENVSEDGSINAAFSRDLLVFEITAVSGQGGVISPVGPVSVNEGESRSFSIVPDQGFEISDVLVDGVSVGVTTTYEFLNVTSSHMIEAKFSELPRLESIIISPENTIISVGGQLQFTARTSDQFGSEFPVTIFWSSLDEVVGTIDNESGLFISSRTGTTQITASAGSVVTSTFVTVTSTPELKTLSVTPDLASIFVGEKQQFSVLAADQDGNPFPVEIFWSTSDFGIATISSLGLANGVSVGTVVITASSSERIATSTLKVNAPVPPSPPPPTGGGGGGGGGVVGFGFGGVGTLPPSKPDPIQPVVIPVIGQVLGEKVYDDGMLLRSKLNKKVYVIFEGKRILVSSSNMKMFSGKKINDVEESEISGIPNSSVVLVNYANGTLIRTPNKKIYVVKNYIPKHIVSLEEFKRDYRGKTVINVDSSFNRFLGSAKKNSI